MAWSFTRTTAPGGTNQKTAVQLQREAAVVLALGGGFQAYFKQKRDGSIYDERMPVMAEVAKFCRARQAICHHAESVPQVALLFSTPAHYRRTNGLFSRELSRLAGTLQALLESQQSVEVLGEHHLAGRMAEYPLIVVPEWEYLEPKFKADLVAYVNGGGNLVAGRAQDRGPVCRRVGRHASGRPAARRRDYPHAKRRAGHDEGPKASRAIGTAGQTVRRTPRSADPNSPPQPAASITALGRGQIAATYFTFGQGYLSTGSQSARQFLNGLVRQLFPKPLVQVEGSSDVDVSVNRSGGKLAVNLVNTAGPHADRKTPVFETIPPVGPLEITIRLAKAPEHVTVEPGGQPLTFEHRDGEVRLTLPKLEIHSIVVVD